MREGVHTLAAMQMVLTPRRQLFICDTHVNRDPGAAEIAEMTLLAVEQIQRFGLKPSVALLSHSSFGSSDAASAQKMREALELILARMPDLAVEGEMQADAALSAEIRDREFPDSRLNIDAANITYNALRVIAGVWLTAAPPVSPYVGPPTLPTSAHPPSSAIQNATANPILWLIAQLLMVLPRDSGSEQKAARAISPGRSGRGFPAESPEPFSATAQIRPAGKSERFIGNSSGPAARTPLQPSTAVATRRQPCQDGGCPPYWPDELVFGQSHPAPRS